MDGGWERSGAAADTYSWLALVSKGRGQAVTVKNYQADGSKKGRQKMRETTESAQDGVVREDEEEW